MLVMVTWVPVHTYSQDSLFKMKAFKVKMYRDNQVIYNRNLKALTDTTIHLLTESSPVKNPYGKKWIETFHYSEIDRLIIRRKGAAGKGALAGALVGLSIGVMAGLISGDDPPCVASNQDFLGLGYVFCEAFRMTAGEKARLYGISGAVTGSVIGLMVGAVARKKFMIGKRKEQFREMQGVMMGRLYRK